MEMNLTWRFLSNKPHYENVPFEIPVGWEWCKLDDLAFYKKGPFGSSLTKSMFVPDCPTAYKVYEQKNAINKDYSLGHYFINVEKHEELKGFAVSPHDIIVSCAGTIGETYVLPKNIRAGIINQALMIIRLYDTSITDFYLLYFDFILKNEAANESKGTAIKNIPPFDVLKNYLIPIPPLKEQIRIIEEVHKWLGVVQQIEYNGDDISNLISKTKSKILDLAIHGKLVPQDPNDEPAIDLIKRINPPFVPCNNAHWEKQVPIGWTYATLSDCLVEILNGYAFQSSKYTNSGIRVIRITNVQDGFIEDNVPKFYSLSFRNDIEKYMLYTNDLLMSLTGNVGRVGFLPEQMLPAALNQRVGCIRPNIKILTKAYLFFLFQTEIFRKDCIASSKGVAQLNISTEWLKNYSIPIPPIQEQQRIVAKIEKLFTVLDEIKESLEA